VAAADKKDSFPIKRPPRAVSFKRMLGLTHAVATFVDGDSCAIRHAPQSIPH